jgi:signal transduction histidine kinase
VRLDECSEGAGLGLAIVQDVLDAYNWRLELDKSELGGLKATVSAQANDEVVSRKMALAVEQS